MVGKLISIGIIFNTMNGWMSININAINGHILIFGFLSEHLIVIELYLKTFIDLSVI